MTETRQTFAGLAHWEIVFWYVLIVVSTAIFFWGVALLVLKYRRGRATMPVEGLGRRALRAATGSSACSDTVGDPPAAAGGQTVGRSRSTTGLSAANSSSACTFEP